MRALFEATEDQDRDFVKVPELLASRSWNQSRLKSLLATARKQGFIKRSDSGIGLSRAGEVEAERIVRNHRLWEMYLITYADIAPSHVDRDADRVEHVLDPVTIAQLEDLLRVQDQAKEKLASPHPLSGEPG